MAVKRSSRRYPAARLESLARRLLKASPLCSIATVTPPGRAHINAAYFAWSKSFDIVWLSEPKARHSRNLKRNPSAAIVVYDSGQVWGKPDRGIMLYGSARQLTRAAARAAAGLYAQRFPRFDPDDTRFGVYRLTPTRVKIFHERQLGGGVFVTVRNRSGHFGWEKTELYE